MDWYDYMIMLLGNQGLTPVIGFVTLERLF